MVFNHHLQFTSYMFKNNQNIPPDSKQCKVKIHKSDKFPSLDIRMSWSLEWGLKFGLYRNKGHELKYVRKDNTHTYGMICAILSVFL